MSSGKISVSKDHILYQCPSDVGPDEIESSCVPIACYPTDQYSENPNLHSGSSQLWGTSGERWNPQGRLPYFWSAGYQSGEEPPRVSETRNVLEFGAIPNDETEDTQAFQEAIDAIKNGALRVPAGRYIIRDV